MADEITISIQGRVAKGLLRESFGELSLSEDLAGKQLSEGTQTVGLTSETLPLGDVGTDIGRIWIKNNSAADSCVFGPDGTSFPVEVVAGSQAYLGWNSTAIHAKGITSIQDIYFRIIQN